MQNNSPTWRVQDFSLLIWLRRFHVHTSNNQLGWRPQIQFKSKLINFLPQLLKSTSANYIAIHSDAQTKNLKLIHNPLFSTIFHPSQCLRFHRDSSSFQAVFCYPINTTDTSFVCNIFFALPQINMSPNTNLFIMLSFQNPLPNPKNLNFLEWIMYSYLIWPQTTIFYYFPPNIIVGPFSNILFSVKAFCFSPFLLDIPFYTC